jgi:transglutaminase-like putative cysteine protease
MHQGFRLVTLAALLSLALTMPARAADWLPVTPEELQMKSEPKAPKAAAIFLYRQVDRDDEDATETFYNRIKILTDEGREYANVEIPYTKGENTVRAVQARVIRPDGGIIEFDGTVYEKSLVKARGLRVNTKTFTLPNVEVGSIIEYRYRRQMRMGWVWDSRWLISADLFTRHAKFSLKPAENFLLRWSWPLGLPDGTKPPEKERGLIRLETRDVPAFVSEEFMPPEDVMKYRVEFVYEGEDSDQREEAAYWKAYGKRSNTFVQRFTKPTRALEEEVARLVQPGDSIEVKARKLYARAQQLRNLSFERQATEQEAQREKLADINDVDDVLKHGYGYGRDISWFFYGLLRAAKIESYLVLISTRDVKFFDPRMMNTGDLNNSVVLVNLGDGTVYCDPGVQFMPFAYLPWNETAVKGLRLDKDGGQWVTTTLPGRDDSRIERKAVMKLESGSLEGKVTVTYVGLEASWRRVSERNEDATERKKFLEDELEAVVPTGIEAKLTNTPDWTGSETPLVAEFEVSVPGWAAGAGSRALMPMGLFSRSEKHMFEHSARVHPVYFGFPYRHVDDITIELPQGWQTSAVPKARAIDINVTSYSSSAQATGGTLNIRREITLNTILVKVPHYPQLRDFYQAVRAGDEDQIVITPGASKK